MGKKQIDFKKEISGVNDDMNQLLNKKALNL